MLSDKNARYVLEEMIILYPNLPPNLNFKNSFELMIATILSAQTTDTAVNALSPILFKRFPTPKDFATANLSEIVCYIKPLGLYTNKARFLKESSQQLLEWFDGQVPSNREDLEKLTGVGRKTASVILSVGFGQPAFAVDTHVNRVCKHHAICAPNASLREVEERVTGLLPAEQWLAAHRALIAFGRDVCHPKNPQCQRYPQLYDFPEKGGCDF